jgi:predicted amidohydrolase
MATANPARVINRDPKLGTLQVGAPGDVTVLDVVQGPVEFVDTRNNRRSGTMHLRPLQAVVAGGRVFVGPVHGQSTAQRLRRPSDHPRFLRTAHACPGH